MGRRTLAYFSPGRVILFTFLFTILIGTGALWLPWAHAKPIPLIDLFFTATSATCVTGLFTIPLTDFTFFGHIILLLLVQIGGLGLITMTLFLLSLVLDLGLATQFMAEKLLEVSTWKQIKRLLLFTIGCTLLCELGGMLILQPSFATITPDHPWFYALFHAVSSFCNAGIVLAGNYLAAAHSYVLLATTAVLIFIGGLGFIALHELTRYSSAQIHHKAYRLSLHTKIIVHGTILLILFGTILFFILERNNTLEGLSPFKQLFISLFNAVSFRSTGFSLIAPYNFQLATLFSILLLAVIGSAPGSTGSGIKVTTTALFLATVRAAITGRTSVEIYGRSIPKDLIYKAIAVIFLSLAWIALTTFCLLITEQNWTFFDSLFEATSAFTNLGLSIQATDALSSVGKLCISANMIIGRIGSLTLILALKLRRKSETSEFTYPEERVMLG